MRRGTTLLVGGAVAVALALGALVGGVFAESPSAGPSAAAAWELGRSPIRRSPERVA